MNYRICEETLLLEGINYISYGINLYNNGKCIKHIPNVFTDKITAETFINLCNKHKLSPIHLEDFIDDYMCMH